MPSIPRSGPKRNIDSQKVAAQWLSEGIYPVPLLPRSKQPKGGKGWNTLRVTPETIPQYFEDGDNVGGLWGEPSNWIVDVDLDTEEAIAAARLLLPPTYVYGRIKRPRSHYLYRCADCAGAKFTVRTPDDKVYVVVEIRSTGAQSVLPPSIHPEGDRYTIDEEQPFTSLTPKRLLKHVGEVGAAALLAEHYPTEGARHDYMHAIAGMLLHRGWEPERVRVFCEAVLDGAGKRETDRPQRERTVRNTIKSFREGGKVAGLTSLSPMIGGLITYITKWIGQEAPQVSIIDTDLSDAPDRRDVKIVPPPELLEVPGLVGDVAQWIEARAFARQPLFNLAVGLATVAFASGNKYIVDSWNTPLQPYMLLLAPSASGKEAALDSVGVALRKIGYANHWFKGFQSYHSLLDTLAEPPHAAIWLWDEAARKMKTAMRNQAGSDYQIITHLLELYGKGHSTIGGIPGRKRAIAAIDQPFLSVMAAAQPAQLVEAITDSDVSLGLINRFILFDGGNHLPEDNEQRQFLFPKTLEADLKVYRDIKVPMNGAEYPAIHIRFESTAVYNAFRDFHRHCRELAVKGGGWEMWGRANQNALIIAGIVAIGISPKHPVITMPVAKWATAFLEWSSDRWTQRIEECSARSITERSSKSLERAIRNARAFSHRTAGHLHEEKLVRRGYMPRSLIQRLMRHMRPKELEESLGALIAMNLACFGEVEGVECYWPPN